MPFSVPLGKDMTIEYVRSNFPVSARILDIGCGNGTYAHLLGPLGYKLDGVEVYKPNIDRFELARKYQTVFPVDVRSIENSGHYDLAIFGDVLEHLTVAEARLVIDRFKKFCDVILVSVPYRMGQGAYEGNTYETHLQPDLDDKVFMWRYPEFRNLTVESADGFTIGVWIYDGRPTVMINVLLKNSMAFFHNLMRQIGGLRYPKGKISLAFLENDSEDGTLAMVKSYMRESLCDAGYARVRLDTVKTGFKLLPTERHIPEKQKQRLETIAKMREHVNHDMYLCEDFVWNVDHDFFEMDQWLLSKMASADKDVLMVPVYLPGGNDLYDLGTGIHVSSTEFLKVDEVRKRYPGDLVRINWCSAACMFRGSLISKGVTYLSDDLLHKQEGGVFSCSAHSLGAEIWLLANEKIIHCAIDGNKAR